MTTIKYLMDEYPETTFVRSEVRRFGVLQITRGQGANGYGNKITTDYMAITGHTRRRVYAICHSNAASHYVIVRGEKMFIRDFDIPDEVRKG